jgi:uncharacterized protein YbjT (DUF2867 family)
MLRVAALAVVLFAGQAIAMAETVLVAGASGGTGRLLVERLLADGLTVRGLTRDPDEARERTGLDIEWVAGDVRDPVSLARVFAGVEYVQCAVGAREPFGANRPEMVDYKGVTHLVDAAKAAGSVKRFVLLSSANVTIVGHPFNAGFNNLLIWKYLGEDHLRRSGLEYAIVRPPQLLDEAGGIAGIRLQQGDPGGPGQMPRADLADVMIEAMTSPHTRNATFEIFRDTDLPPGGWRDRLTDLTPDS